MTDDDIVKAAELILNIRHHESKMDEAERNYRIISASHADSISELRAKLARLKSGETTPGFLITDQGD